VPGGLWIRNVPSGEEAQVVALEKEIPPELVAWLRTAQSQGEGRRVLRQGHVSVWNGVGLRDSEIYSSGL
jgi:hypothetical protein